MWDIRYICQSDLIKQIIDNIETMENFIFQNPTKLIFGKGMIGQLAKEIPAGKRILVLSEEEVFVKTEFMIR